MSQALACPYISSVAEVLYITLPVSRSSDGHWPFPWTPRPNDRAAGPWGHRQPLTLCSQSFGGLFVPLSRRRGRSSAAGRAATRSFFSFCKALSYPSSACASDLRSARGSVESV